MTTNSNGKTALLLGATGLIGSHVLPKLLSHPDITNVLAPTRRALNVQTTSSTTLLNWNGADLSQYEPEGDVDHVFCCLGSTIKTAGSQERFAAFDHDLPAQLFEKALAKRAHTLHLVSAVGADPNSKIFYNQIKGRLEQTVMGQSWQHIFIYQPSLLLGGRSEFRLGEWLAQKTMGVVRPLIPASYRPIKAEELALAMVSDMDRSGQAPQVIRIGSSLFLEN